MKLKKAKYYLIPATLFLAGVVGIGYYYFFTSFSEMQETTYVYIDNDDTADSVYAKLQPLTSESALTGFRTLSRHYDYGSHIRTGRYAIVPGVNTVDVFRGLRNGQQEPIMLTVPETRTMEQLASRLASKLMIDSATIVQAVTDQAVCQNLGYDTCTISCIFVPNTYEIYWNTSIERLMDRMAREHDNFWNEERRQKAKAAGLTPNEVCTLASIIDEETANNAEKPMVAGMYINRLRIGMPLQADPTVKFAMKNFGLRRIYNTHLTIDNPYNTYRYAGLPPGPIKIASIAGIDAVLNHARHDYLYMCAKEDFSGTHNFAVTYQEHLRNADRYVKALNQRGIK